MAKATTAELESLNTAPTGEKDIVFPDDTNSEVKTDQVQQFIMTAKLDKKANDAIDIFDSASPELKNKMGHALCGAIISSIEDKSCGAIWDVCQYSQMSKYIKAAYINTINQPGNEKIAEHLLYYAPSELSDQLKGNPALWAFISAAQKNDNAVEAMKLFMDAPEAARAEMARELLHQLPDSIENGTIGSICDMCQERDMRSYIQAVYAENNKEVNYHLRYYAPSDLDLVCNDAQNDTGLIGNENIPDPNCQ